MPSRGACGRLAKKLDLRTIDVCNYTSNSFKAPDSANWTRELVEKSVSIGGLGMMGNDVHGDCTIAALGHAVMTWTANNGSIVKPSDADVLALYAAVDTSAGTGPNDGRVMDTVVKYVRSNGLFGESISFYGRTRFSVPYLKEAIYLGGGLYVGVDLPLSVNNQFANGDDWVVTTGYKSRKGSLGSHAIWICGYDEQRAHIVTWGQVCFVSWPWLLKYIDETFVIISDAWTPNGIAPSHLDTDAINDDLAVIT